MLGRRFIANAPSLAPRREFRSRRLRRRCRAVNNTKFSEFRVATFSSNTYVLRFLEEPLKSVFPNSTMLTAPLDKSTAALAYGHSAVICFVNDVCDRDVLDILKGNGVQLIALRCAGFDRVDVDYAAELGIKVVRVPTYSPHSVAEHAVALLMCLNRSIHLAYNRVWQGNYTLSGLEGVEIRNKIVGVIGTGAIGTAFCSIMKGFGCRILATDLAPSQTCKDLGVEYVDIDELVEVADIVSLHCPLMPSTFHIINEERLDLMKSSSFLINVSRGGLVDTDALIEALEKRELAGCAMDVYDNEGNLFFKDFSKFTSPKRMITWDRKFNTLKSFPNVLITPHSAFLTNEALKNIATTTIENLKEFVMGETLTNEVKPLVMKQ
eukprot:g4466.t1